MSVISWLLKSWRKEDHEFQASPEKKGNTLSQKQNGSSSRALAYYALKALGSIPKNHREKNNSIHITIPRTKKKFIMYKSDIKSQARCQWLMPIILNYLGG
jgi:hypothetical protein